MTTKTDISPEQHIALLRHLAGGKSLDVVATILKLTRDQVFDVARNHGYPDKGKLEWAADVLAKKQDDDNLRASIPTSATLPSSSGTRLDLEVTGPGARAQAQIPAKPDEIRILLNTAKGHPSKRIQAASDKVFDQLDRLRGLLREDQEKNSEKRRLEAERAAARAEVERLEAQLKAAKAKLRGKPATPPSPAPQGMEVFEKPKANTAPRGEYPCRNEGCDQVISTPQGRGLHERQHCAHRPEAAAS